MFFQRKLNKKRCLLPNCQLFGVKTSYKESGLIYSFIDKHLKEQRTKCLKQNDIHVCRHSYKSLNVASATESRALNQQPILSQGYLTEIEGLPMCS